MIHSFWSSVAVVAGVLVPVVGVYALPADHQNFNTSVDGAPADGYDDLFDSVPFLADAEKVLSSEVEVVTGGEPQPAAVDTTRARVFDNLFELAKWNICNIQNSTYDQCRETNMSLDTTSEAGLTVVVIRHHLTVCKGDNSSYVFDVELKDENGTIIDSRSETIDPCLYEGPSMLFENYGTAKTIVVSEYYDLSPPSETGTMVTLLPLNILKEPTKTSDETWADTYAWSYVGLDTNASQMESLTQTVDLVDDAGFTEAYLDKIPAIYLHHWTTHLYCSTVVSGVVQPDTDLVISLLDESMNSTVHGNISFVHSLGLPDLCSHEKLLPAAVVLDDYPRGTRYIQFEKRNRVPNVIFDNFYVGIEPPHVFDSSTDQNHRHLKQLSKWQKRFIVNNPVPHNHTKSSLIPKGINSTECSTDVACGSLSQAPCVVSKECGHDEYYNVAEREAYINRLYPEWYKYTTSGLCTVGITMLEVNPYIGFVPLNLCVSSGLYAYIALAAVNSSYRRPVSKEIPYCYTGLGIRNVATNDNSSGLECYCSEGVIRNVIGNDNSSVPECYYNTSSA